MLRPTSSEKSYGATHDGRDARQRHIGVTERHMATQVIVRAKVDEASMASWFQRSKRNPNARIPGKRPMPSQVKSMAVSSVVHPVCSSRSNRVDPRTATTMPCNQREQLMCNQFLSNNSWFQFLYFQCVGLYIIGSSRACPGFSGVGGRS